MIHNWDRYLTCVRIEERRHESEIRDHFEGRLSIGSAASWTRCSEAGAPVDAAFSTRSSYFRALTTEPLATIVSAENIMPSQPRPPCALQIVFGWSSRSVEPGPWTNRPRPTVPQESRFFPRKCRKCTAVCTCQVLRRIRKSCTEDLRWTRTTSSRAEPISRYRVLGSACTLSPLVVNETQNETFP